MIIVVSGCDKVGKTTFAQALSKILGWEIIKRPKNLLPSTDFANEKTMLAQYRLMYALFKDKNVIFDRYYESELVYSYLRGEDKLEDEGNDLWMFDKEFSQGNTLFIILDEDQRVLTKRFSSDREEYLKAEEVNNILDRFSRFVNRTEVDCLYLNSHVSFKEKMSMVLEYIAEKQLGEEFEWLT